MGPSAAVDWTAIDTVMLDMDGTLLDLRFDNWFWQELIPLRYAERHGLAVDDARAQLAPKFAAVTGTIDWYCIDHWTRQLGLDIASIKREAQTEVRYLPGAEQFLLRLAAAGKRRILVTNAHPETLAIKEKRVALSQHFDASYTAHPFDAPKEDAAFWPQLQSVEPFTPERTLFVDDNLRVLAAARDFGIGWLRAIRCPDSGRPPQSIAGFAAVDRIDELL